MARGRETRFLGWCLSEPYWNLLGQGKRLRYLCQDETRVGLKSAHGKVLTARGIKPVAPVQWGRDNFWIYGVVEPLSGWHFEQEYDHLNSKQFQSFLDALSQALGEDMALIQLDQAKAHQALSLKWVDNLIPVFQPAHSPELNPIERLWQFIKQQIRGENFATRDRFWNKGDNPSGGSMLHHE